jgi:hypothetical protein
MRWRAVVPHTRHPHDLPDAWLHGFPQASTMPKFCPSFTPRRPTSIPDASVTLDDAVAERDRAATRFAWRVSQAPASRSSPRAARSCALPTARSPSAGTCRPSSRLWSAMTLSAEQPRTAGPLDMREAHERYVSSAVATPPLVVRSANGARIEADEGAVLQRPPARRRSAPGSTRPPWCPTRRTRPRGRPGTEHGVPSVSLT